MPTQINNTASLTFEYGSEKGSATSNTAVTTLQDTLSISKLSMGSTYSPENDVFYIITINSNDTAIVKNVKISDDLGSYLLGSVLVSPLTYVGPSQLYINGIFNCELEPKIQQHKITFTIPTISGCSNAMILYKAVPNKNAPLNFDSSITTTATLISKSRSVEPLIASNTIKIVNKADVKIVKSMTPNPVLHGERITYTFSLYNYGNMEATKIMMTDKVTPAPVTVNVTIDGVNILFKDYSYIHDTLTIPSYGSGFSLSVPAATFKQDPLTGNVAIEPGTTTIAVTGKI